jgi:DNA-binding CsgD family transcriptional regulator
VAELKAELETLTKRELEVMSLVSAGLADLVRMAEMLGVSRSGPAGA